MVCTAWTLLPPVRAGLFHTGRPGVRQFERGRVERPLGLCLNPAWFSLEHWMGPQGLFLVGVTIEGNEDSL